VHAQQALPKSGKVIQEKLTRKKKTLASHYTSFMLPKKKSLLPGNSAKNLFSETQALNFYPKCKASVAVYLGVVV